MNNRNYTTIFSPRASVWLGTLACALVWGNAATALQTKEEQSSESVVEITCDVQIDDGKGGVKPGQQRATGFAWIDSMHVVTALHAVVGCPKEDGKVYTYVKKEQAGGTNADVVAAHLESDLALLKLRRDIGLTAIPHATSAPDKEAKHYLYGYPMFMDEMDGGPLTFKWGKGGKLTTTLGKFRDTELHKLLAGQSYPKETTTIMKIGYPPILGGYSGAPVFDESGNVVAIVDGALLGGGKGANWSVPAYLYLPLLRSAGLNMPTELSQTAQRVLKSSVTPADATRVDIDIIQTTADNRVSAQPGQLVLINTPTYADIGEFINDDDRDTYEQYSKNLNLFLKDESRTKGLVFHVYQETSTGALFGVPQGFSVQWDPVQNMITATSPSGKVGLKAMIQSMSSYWQAHVEGTRRFADKVAELAVSWENDKNPADFELKNCVRTADGSCDEDWAWSQYSKIIESDEQSAPVNGIMTAEVSGSYFLGTASYTYGDFNKDLTKEDKINSLMVDVGAKLLADFPTQ